ncbi:hypothetical protein FOMPIDRAFT_84736 [Fomitopsis schrenkii]|uniref:N-acetyltransferase domain-containing protein n=1 Tax=Fomitopsis schrenkii TaxID=2126942 RepID=S8ELG9_FOMSC|nr:hypothetical protein FOMPIDRAFT_84736 [Fomitopsis schrenkii]
MPENRHSVDKANPTTDGLMPEVELLRYGDVARTVARMLYFVKNNAQHHYDAHKNPTMPYRDWLAILLRWMDGVRRHEILTINRGECVLLYSPAPETVTGWRASVNKVVGNAISRLMGVFRFFFTAEQRKRMKELAQNRRAAIAATFEKGTTRKLISIENLVTVTDKQGLGYASTLVNHVLHLAQSQKRGVWLSTNERNIGFYDRFGFKKVGQYSLGENDPIWAEGPVTQYILLREPASPQTEAPSPV